ncbi:Uncharacterised protein [Klebsiella pneumoniae]|nr:Uncharacterised protein [Klebsiella pneumoniae]
MGITPTTVGELVDAVVDLGNTSKVFTFHDEHLSLKSDLPDDFLNKKISDLEGDSFAPEVEEVLEQANTIIKLHSRELSEEDEEEIREEEEYWGNIED